MCSKNIVHIKSKLTQSKVHAWAARWVECSQTSRFARVVPRSPANLESAQSQNSVSHKQSYLLILCWIPYFLNSITLVITDINNDHRDVDTEN